MITSPVSPPEVTAGDHLRVERGDVLLVIGRYRPDRNPEYSLTVLEGRPLGEMRGSPFHSGHTVDEVEGCTQIGDILVARLGAHQHVPDLVIHDLLGDALPDPVEETGAGRSCW